MKQFVFFDGKEREGLLPLTYLRPCCLCRVGIRTIEEKWKTFLSGDFGYMTQDYLQNLYAPHTNLETSQATKPTVFINGSTLPTQECVEAILELSTKNVLMNGGSIVAFIANKQDIHSTESLNHYVRDLLPIEVNVDLIRYPEDILQLSRDQFLKDYNILAQQRSSEVLDSSNKVRGTSLFIGNNVRSFDAVYNTLDGPIYIDDNAEIMENAVLKGPIYVGPSSKIHVGAKVYADTILGPHCKIGGEVKRTTMFGYSNKAHDGFLGDSVLGLWCNLGADTNNSNMKNSYGNVSLWDIKNEQFRKTDRQFLGMVLGDHTMSAINTSFNTGSVTGIFSNILDRVPDRYTPSFTWGKNQKYNVDKAIDVAKIVMLRRGLSMTDGYEMAIRYLAR